MLLGLLSRLLCWVVVPVAALGDVLVVIMVAVQILVPAKVPVAAPVAAAVKAPSAKVATTQLAKDDKDASPFDEARSPARAARVASSIASSLISGLEKTEVGSIRDRTKSRKR